LPIPLAYSQRLCGCCNGICGCFFAGSGQPFSAPWALWLIQSHTCLPCSFVSCWRRKLCCTCKALAALCIAAGRKVYSILFSAHTWNRSPVSSWWASFGVCGLLALPTIHQIFGDNPAEYPLSACLGVGFLLLRAVCSGCGCDGNIGHFSLRTSFWGTQWGQLNRPHTLLLL